MGRREDEVVRVEEECREVQRGERWPERVLGVRADFTVAEEMVGVREAVERGVSARTWMVLCGY